MDSIDKNTIECDCSKKSNKDTFLKLTNYFSTYMDNMFNDLSKLIIKRLDAQQKKIIQNQKHLKEIQKIFSFKKSHCSSTSIGDMQSENLIKQPKRKKISSFKQAKDVMSIEKISQILIKMEANVLYLQGSISRLKISNEIQDPQTVSQSEASISEQNKKQTQTTLNSNISKLTTRITKLAKESSIEQIEKQNALFAIRKCQLPKTKSLLSISSRKYHPVSCPKNYQYGLRSGKDQSSSEIDREVRKAKQYLNIKYQLSENLLPAKNTENNGNNKMPLINQANTLLNQLLQSCSDQADASVIKFHLKKTYKKIDEMIGNKKKQPSKNNILIEINNNDKENLSQTFVAVPEYFVNKTFNSNKLNLTECQNQQNRNPAQCSIVENLSANQQSKINWVKENYSSFHTKGLSQNDSSFHHYGSTKNNQSETQDSRQNRKYFQRSSNDHKITMLKKKLKQQTVKL